MCRIGPRTAKPLWEKVAKVSLPTCGEPLSSSDFMCTHLRFIKFCITHREAALGEGRKVVVADARGAQGVGFTCNNNQQLNNSIQSHCVTHREDALEEGGEDVVADAGGAEGVDAHIGAGLQPELEVQGAQGGHRRAHGVPDDVPRRAGILCGGMHCGHSRMRCCLYLCVLPMECTMTCHGALWYCAAIS